MRLTDLNPRWCDAGGKGVINSTNGEPVPLREKIGLIFDCPCGCGSPCFIPFSNPVDGKPSTHLTAWERTGEGFETMTLRPSIQRIPMPDGTGCKWHGFITNGEIISI